MEVEITPEPTPEEREALIAALERLLEAQAEPEAYRSAWWRAGLEEDEDGA